tara:strand:+ start:129 stop:410 length:282 start_codon:yes stop_codon:yes gene_type:complete
MKQISNNKKLPLIQQHYTSDQIRKRQSYEHWSTLVKDAINLSIDFNSIKILIRSVWWMMDEKYSFGTFQQSEYEAESLELALVDELKELQKKP